MATNLNMLKRAFREWGAMHHSPSSFGKKGKIFLVYIISPCSTLLMTYLGWATEKFFIPHFRLDLRHKKDRHKTNS